MLEENLRSKLFDSGADRNQRTRRWHCPEDGVIAGYVDCTLTETRRSQVQRHLADCGYCRALVADIVKIRREAEVPAAPIALVDKALAVLPSTPRRWRRIWVPVTALGTAAVCTMIAATVLQPPDRLVLPSWSAPAAPIISESGPQPPARTPGREIVRNQTSPQPSPSIISPKAGSAVSGKTVDFHWKAVPHSLYYQVRIVTSEGELVWEGQSTGTHLELPNDAPLNNGKYFVLVSAFMENGRIMKSDPVGFQIASSR
jgi:putative zinc finger protein